MVATTLPAVVRVVDLPTGTTVTGAELIEAVQTSGGVGQSVQLSLNTIATSLGIPAGGATGTILNKSSGSNYSTQFSAINTFVNVGTSLATTGSATSIVAFVANQGISSTEILNNTITSSQMANNAIGTNQLASSLGIASSLSIGTLLTVGGTATFNGGIVLNGTLGLTGTTLITGTFGVVGTSQFTGAFNVVGTSLVTGTLGVIGTTLFTSGTFGVVGTTNITGTFGQVGTSLMTGQFGVMGTASFTSTFTVLGTATFTGNFNFNILGTTFITGTFAQVGTSLMTGQFGVVGTSTFTGAHNVLGTTIITGSVGIIGTTIITGALGLPNFTSVYLVTNSTGLVSGTTAAPASNFVLLNTLTPNGVASATDTSSLTSTYANYMVMFDNVCTNTTNTNFQLLVATSGANWTTASYISMAQVNVSSVIVTDTSASAVLLSGTRATTQVQTTVSYGVNGFIKLMNPSSGFIKFMTGQVAYLGSGAGLSTATLAGANLHAYFFNGSPVTGLNFQFSGQNIATGIIKIYGIT